MKLAALTLTSALLLATAAHAETPFSKERLEWNKPQKPFHMIGNLYYVGMAGVAVFLIKTDDGLIVTDGGLPESAPVIEKNIRALGFQLKDVKLLLNSHAHFDHSGGLPRLKKDTGAKLAAGAADKPFLESGHITFGPSAKIDTIPVHVDQAVKDGDKVSLGDVTLTAHATPGHTKGCTTWTMPLSDGGKTYKVMFFCSISVAGNPLVGDAAYPNIQNDYKASFAKLNAMQADIFLAPHGVQFGLADKLAKIKPGAPNPFIDPGELHRFLTKARVDYDAELAKQVAAAKKP
jgi:metallo-beta-lactamase class B